MSDLIVIGYPDEATAEKAWGELVKLQQDFLVDLEDAAIVRRDRKGRLHVTTPAHHAVAWGTLSGLFWGVLIGLVFLWPLAPAGRRGRGHHGGRARRGREPRRQGRFPAAGPGPGAARDVSDPGHRPQGDPGQVPRGVKPYGGTVLKTSLPHDAEQQLMQALHGDDPVAPTWQQPASAGAQA